MNILKIASSIITLSVLMATMPVNAMNTPKYLKWDGYANLEDVYNFKGGIKRGNEFEGNGLIRAIVDTKKANMWNNGQFNVGVLGIYVTSNQYKYSGMLQSPSNIYSANSEIRISDLSYQHNFTNKAKVVVGIMDMNNYFDIIEHTGALLNDAFETCPAIIVNAPTATYPYPGFGALIDFPTKYIELQAGIFQGNPQQQHTVFYDGYMLVGEMITHPNIEPQTNVNWNLKLGAWHYQQSNKSIGHTNNGMYVIGERIWSNGDNEARSLFVQAGFSPVYANLVQYSLSLGFNVNAVFPSRVDDVLSLGFTEVWIHHVKPEIVYELGYCAKLTKHFYLTPDLQFAYHPSGIYHHQALVGILRLAYKP